MTSAFLRKLRLAASLTDSDEEVLVKLTEPARRVGRGDVRADLGASRSTALVIEGWVCRSVLLENGKRQITSVFLPGDLCSPFGAWWASSDFVLTALTPACLAFPAQRAMRDAARSSPRIEEALWWDVSFTDALQHEHAVSLGRRTATERLGYFFCEVHARLAIVGGVDCSSYDMPLTQAELGDLCGLSAVHVNRSIQDLRSIGLISLIGRRVTIHHIDGLRELSMFEPRRFPQVNAGRERSRALGRTDAEIT